MYERRISALAFTLVELMFTAALASGVALMLFTFTTTANRLVTRNFAANHGHDASRVAFFRMWSEVLDADSPFRLLKVTGDTAFTAIDTPANSGTTDQLTKVALSERAGGFKVWDLAARHCQIAGNGTHSSIASFDTDMEFDLSTNDYPDRDAKDTRPRYIPLVGDKVYIPLFKAEFLVEKVLKSDANAATLRLKSANKGQTSIGFTLPDVKTYPATAYFYRCVAYTVYNGQLRFHPNFYGAQQSQYVVICNHVTSPAPFALLLPPDLSGQTAPQNLHISLETTDSAYTARKFAAGTTTLQGMLTPRNHPAPVTSTELSEL